MKARCCAQKRSSTTDILLALKVQHCRVDPWSSDSAFPCRHYATKKENEVKPGFLPSTGYEPKQLLRRRCLKEKMQDLDTEQFTKRRTGLRTKGGKRSRHKEAV